MDVDGFWELIERSRPEANDPQARLGWLQRQLAKHSTAEIVDLQIWLDRVRRRADTEVLQLVGRPVDDWSQEDWPDWESLSYVAWEAYEQVTGEEEGLSGAMEAQGHHSPSDPDPTGERWDFEDPAEAALRLPRLSWMFPLTDRATRDQRGREAFDRMLADRGQTEEEFIAEFLGRGAGSQEPPDRT
jgi:Protein of unknown function (DUF4240)